ncbi:MAG: hypothetical protein KatS3mg087_0108 [Patescibacteria group bacterium]|nr:MAG: hypothetical protein KatS3mg087_0108 [Patescibacteria group bacterium]
MSADIVQSEFIKKAVHVDVGSSVLGALSQLFGRIPPGSTFRRVFPEVYDYPISKKDPRLAKIESLARTLEEAAEGDLDKRVFKELQIYTGGPDIINDLLFLKHSDGPWYKRIGGRIWHLPYSVPLKVLFTLLYPQIALITSMMPGPMYVPPLHAVVKAPASEPVLMHELGHALDMGRALYKSEKYPFLKKLLYQLHSTRYKQEPVQLYSPRAELPSKVTPPVKGIFFGRLKPDSDKIPIIILREQLANSLSYQLFSWAVQKGLISREEAEKIIRNRSAILPLGYYTYARKEFTQPGFKTPLPQEDGKPRKFKNVAQMLSILREPLKEKAEKLTQEDIEKSIQEAANLYLKSVGIDPEQIKTEDKVRKSVNKVSKP